MLSNSQDMSHPDTEWSGVHSLVWQLTLENWQPIQGGLDFGLYLVVLMGGGDCQTQNNFELLKGAFGCRSF